MHLLEFSSHEHLVLNLVNSVLSIIQVVQSDKPKHQRALRLSFTINDSHCRDIIHQQRWIVSLGSISCSDGAGKEIIEILFSTEVRQVTHEKFVRIILSSLLLGFLGKLLLWGRHFIKWANESLYETEMSKKNTECMRCREKVLTSWCNCCA